MPANSVRPAVRAGGKSEQFKQPAFVQHRMDGWMGQQRFDLGGEQQRVACPRDEQRLDAHTVPCEEHPLLLLIPNREGEYTIQPFHARRAPLDVREQQRLGIRMREEGVAFFDERLPELRRVVELTVVDDDVCIGADAANHRLAPTGGIHDGQSPVPQCHLMRQEGPRRVGTPVRTGVHHGGQGPALSQQIIFKVHDPRDTAHNKAPRRKI